MPAIDADQNRPADPEHCGECGDPATAHTTDLGCLLCACAKGRTMPITILDYVESKVGRKVTYTAADFASNGVEMIGGCELCAATIGACNAYPSTSGNWRCAGCIGYAGVTR
jgi:hypothetical protein